MKKEYLIFLLLILLTGCSKSKNEYIDSGSLTGPDLKMNVCSGGVYLKTSNKLYHIEKLPGMTSQQLYNLNFPVTIYFNGTATGNCIGLADDGYFIITAFKF